MISMNMRPPRASATRESVPNGLPRSSSLSYVHVELLRRLADWPRHRRAGRGAAASVRRPTALAVYGRVDYRERDPRFPAHRSGMFTGA
jgi:hypothetical protein